MLTVIECDLLICRFVSIWGLVHRTLEPSLGNRKAHVYSASFRKQISGKDAVWYTCMN